MTAGMPVVLAGISIRRFRGRGRGRVGVHEALMRALRVGRGDGGGRGDGSCSGQRGIACVAGGDAGSQIWWRETGERQMGVTVEVG